MTKIGEIENSIEMVKMQIQTKQEKMRNLEAEWDTEKYTERPSYPNDQQKNGMEHVVQCIRENKNPNSAHGDTVEGSDGYLAVDGFRGHIYFRHKSPMSKTYPTSRLWYYNPNEVVAIMNLVLRHNFIINDVWLSHEGLTVAAKLKN